MSIENNWLCYYNGEASLGQLVHADDPREAVRWFVANVARSWETDWEPIHVWVRPSGTTRRGARLFVAERRRDGPGRLVYEERL